LSFLQSHNSVLINCTNWAHLGNPHRVYYVIWDQPHCSLDYHHLSSSSPAFTSFYIVLMLIKRKSQRNTFLPLNNSTLSFMFLFGVISLINGFKRSYEYSWNVNLGMSHSMFRLLLAVLLLGALFNDSKRMTNLFDVTMLSFMVCYMQRMLSWSKRRSRKTCRDEVCNEAGPNGWALSKLTRIKLDDE